MTLRDAARAAWVGSNHSVYRQPVPEDGPALDIVRGILRRYGAYIMDHGRLPVVNIAAWR